MVKRIPVRKVCERDFSYLTLFNSPLSLSQLRTKTATSVPTPSESTTIESLPDDLLEHIAEILQEERLFASLSALDQTSKRMSGVCKKVLWQDVTLKTEAQMMALMARE